MPGSEWCLGGYLRTMTGNGLGNGMGKTRAPAEFCNILHLFIGAYGYQKGLSEGWLTRPHGDLVHASWWDFLLYVYLSRPERADVILSRSKEWRRRILAKLGR